MSYTELESGYQGLRQQNRPGFYVGHDGNIVSYVSLIALFLSHDMDEFDWIQHLLLLLLQHLLVLLLLSIVVTEQTSVRLENIFDFNTQIAFGDV